MKSFLESWLSEAPKIFAREFSAEVSQPDRHRCARRHLHRSHRS
jgi:hypothetical protein